MNSLKLTSNQTIHYSYHPDTDNLTIQLQAAGGRTEEEALPQVPHVSLQRDAQSGEVVALTVRSVQEVILQTLVRTLVEQVQPYLGAQGSVPRTPAAASDEEVPTRESDEREHERLEAEALAVAGIEELKPAKKSRRRRKKGKKARTEQEGEFLGADILGADDDSDEEYPEAALEAPRVEEGAASAGPLASPILGEQDDRLGWPTPEGEASLPPVAVEAAPEAMAPMRGRRGRKREAVPAVEENAPDSTTISAEAAAAEDPLVEAVASDREASPQEAAPPKKRGRKKATEPEAVVEQPVVVPEGEVKGKRGRKKASEPEATELAADSSSAEAEKPKGKGGRKKAVEVEGIAESESPADVLDSEADATPVKPKRGRKATAEAEAQAEPPTTGRGRSRKKATEEAPVAELSPSESLPPVEEAAEEPAGEDSLEGAPDDKPSKSARRRNRRRKGKSAAASESVLSEAAEEELESLEAGEAEASEAATDEEEKSPRRKRRRKKKRTKTGEATSATAGEPAPSVPVAAPLAGAAQREAGGRRREESDEEEGPRRSYKTAPIPGLDAPEAFAFMAMDPLLGQAIAAMGFEEPTPIQRRAVPEALKGRDIIGLAQTGTGKTIAFLIPGLQRLLTNKVKGHPTRMLVLTPTRELALQVSEEAEYLATHTDLRISTIYGGVGFKRQINELRNGSDVVVATPGRLLDHLKRGNMRLDNIEVLVLDEADRMLDMGFLPEIRDVIRRLPKDRQTMLYSATMPPAIQSLSMDFQREPLIIEVARQLPPATIDQRLYEVERHLKVPLLIHLLSQDPTMGSVLVFTETKSEADVVARKLREADIAVALMHGDRNQREREEALLSLRKGTVKVLVATNVAARGLDIYDITHVINFDVPQTVDDYVHRIGRTARGEAEGKAYTFASHGDIGMVMRIESALERSLPRDAAEGFDYDVPTPSWAKPSADDIIETLHKPKGLADRFSRMMRRR